MTISELSVLCLIEKQAHKMDKLCTSIEVEELPIHQENMAFGSLLDILMDNGYLAKAKEKLRSKKEEVTNA